MALSEQITFPGNVGGTDADAEPTGMCSLAVSGEGDLPTQRFRGWQPAYILKISSPWGADFFLGLIRGQP